jgi:MoxR-like ATPase
MNNATLHRQVSLIPLPVLNAALNETGTDKAAAIAKVIALINQGLITLDQAKGTVPNSAKQAPSAHGTAKADNTSPAPVAPINPAITDQLLHQAKEVTQLRSALGAVHTEARDGLRTITADVANISTKVADVSNEVQQKVAAAEARIERKLKATSVNSEAVDKAVGTAVSDAFAKFRKATPKTRLEEIAASLPPAVRVKSAAEVFGDETCRYGSNDFGSLNVQLWDCPNAPALVDDYVFSPEHLHQALLALDDKLPDNVWLAGERGTGKTEFVTQLAARLQRPLFRVNFDEALERADFIGANTIENSNVVWKAGIIAQAIQTHGALILLDEIGFARAQSIAVLHSLCERSPHRALTVSETGVRIPVASDVAFFVADNSNGHGDASGNFAGVREQNSAFIDRFSYTLEFNYLPNDKEAALIVARTGLPLAAANLIVRFATVARQKAEAGVISQPPSIRQLFAWARAVGKGLPNAIAFRNAVINKFPEDCSGELQGIFLAEINEADFIAALGA